MSGRIGSLYRRILLLVAVILIVPTKSNAATVSDAEKLVKKAENAATVLKWEVSFRKSKDQVFRSRDIT